MARQSRDTVSLNTAFKYIMQDIDLKKELCNIVTYIMYIVQYFRVTYCSGKLKSLFIHLDLHHL